jgi:hypothetical protein
VNDIDVTNQVDFHNNDDEFLPLTKCACGQKFEPWDFSINIYREDARTCTNCGRKLYFRLDIKVFEVHD